MAIREYEGMFLINPDLGPDAAKKSVEAITGIIEKNGGKVANVQDWGKRKLSYLVKGKTDAVYALYQFSIEPTTLARVQELVNLNDSILKYLFVQKTEPRSIRIRKPKKLQKTQEEPVAN